MPRSNRPFSPAATFRGYVAAVLINLALVNTVLTPPDRPRASQARIVTMSRRFSDTELLVCDDGFGVLSIPYERGTERPLIAAN